MTILLHVPLFSGATVSHSFVLESQAKGLFHGSPAVIKFRVPTKAALQVLSRPYMVANNSPA